MKQIRAGAVVDLVPKNKTLTINDYDDYQDYLIPSGHKKKGFNEAISEIYQKLLEVSIDREALAHAISLGYSTNCYNIADAIIQSQNVFSIRVVKEE